MKITCPHCGKPTLFLPENVHRPFCSERCATLDLGAWADEQYRVPVMSVHDNESDPVNENSEREPTADVDLPPKHHLN